MKLIFNPKSSRGGLDKSIFLLDEPGSYLHSSAQIRLTKRLKDISKNNKIIYCTHSPYLLSPQYISINSIRIAEKSTDGSIELKFPFESRKKINKKNSAYQPVYDALDVRPILLDYDIDHVVLVEGIYDYLSFEMFKSSSRLNFFPCVNADSIHNNISYMIFLRKKYLAMWDNDKEGKDQMKKAQKYFGEIEARKFLTLPALTSKKNTRLEDLYEPHELTSYRTAMEIPKNQSLEKTVIHLFYSDKRISNLAKFFASSQLKFTIVMNELEKKMQK